MVEAERAAKVARAERRLAQATGSLPSVEGAPLPARTPTPPGGTESPTRRPARPPGPPLRPAPAEPPRAQPPARPAARPSAPARPAPQRPARLVGPPLAPAPREPLPVSAGVYVEETPTDGFAPVRAERTLPPGTWLSFRG